MADTTDVARLVAVLEADISKFSTNMAKAQAEFNARAAAIEARQGDMVKKLSSNFSLTQLRNTIFGTAALYGLERFVSSVVQSAKSIEDTAKAIGISTDALQEWGTIAARGGVDQDTFNAALEHFSKQVGQAQLGTGAYFKLMKSLGIPVTGDLETNFYRLSDAVKNTSSQQQRSAIVTAAFGKSSQLLTAFVSEGSKAIRAQGDELLRNGEIMSSAGIGKIQQAGIAWQEFKRELTVAGSEGLVAFLDSFHQFTGDMSSTQFQSALKNFGDVMGLAAAAIVKMAPYLPTLTGAAIGYRFGGPLGAVLGGAAGFIAQTAATSKVPQDTAHLDIGPPAGPPGVDRTGAEAANNAEAALKELANLQYTLAQAEASARSASIDATLAGMKAQIEAQLAAKKGAADFYEFQRQSINDIADLDLITITKTQVAAVAASREEAEKQIADLSDKKLSDQQYADASVAIIQTMRDKIDYINNKGIRDSDAVQQKVATDTAQSIEDEFHAKQDALDLNDQLKTSLLDIGAASLSGFGSMEKAAGAALQQIAALILKLYVLQPLVEGLLGPPGTSGGGSAGGLIGGGSNFIAALVSGFAGGGVMTSAGPMALRRYAGGGVANSPQVAMFGEGDTPEAYVPLPDGRRIPVNISMPVMPTASRAGGGTLRTTLEMNINVFGTSDKELVAQFNVAAAQALAAYDATLPSRVAALRQDPWTR